MSDTEMRTAYVVFFDSSNPSWQRDETYSRLFLRALQQYLNQKLMSRGFVFLNEVFDELNLPWTSEGQVYGWFWEKGSWVIDFNEKLQEDGSWVITLHPDGEVYKRLP